MMRKISKSEPPAEFEKFKADFLAENGKEATFDDFIASNKRELKIKLIDEQHAICCYCMKRIDWYNSHIEHFIPQSVDSNKQMDYFNLLASCNGIKEARENCGHKKDDWYDEHNTVSPMSDLCEQIFEFTPDGRMKSEDIRGRETIAHLDLNNELLRRARRRAIYISGALDEDMNDEKKEALIREYQTVEAGSLPEFCQAVVYCLEHI